MVDIEEQIGQLESQISTVLADIDRCVIELLVDSGGRQFVAERLPKLGSAALPSILRLLGPDIDDIEVRFLAGLVGVALGDRSVCVTELFEELARGGRYMYYAADNLVGHRIPGAVEAILEALELRPLDDAMFINSLLSILHRSGGTLPLKLRNRLLLGGSEVTSSLQYYFPADVTPPIS